jgi:peptidoglycan/xylan/chitin deacetylase (PgdA/CDA1 family)
MRRVTVVNAVGGAVLGAVLITSAFSYLFASKPTVAAATPPATTARVATTNAAEPELVTGTVTPREARESAGSLSGLSAEPQMPASDRRKAEVASAPACTNPNALGVSRTLELDTTGGPGLGMSQYTAYDFLQPGEIVLTFDDGPWPHNTAAVLAALSAECLKATFFPIGKHATWHPEILKQVFAAGHSVGSHTWSHVDLSKKTFQEAKDEIEKGISGVTMSAGQPIAPIFRFPALRQSAELKAYLAERNVATFSIDIDSKDFKLHKPEQVIASVMTQLKKRGKGIVLLHDFQRSTALALPELLNQIKAGGYKVVHIKTKGTLTTLPEYDSQLVVAQTGRAKDRRPASDIFRTVNDAGN